MTFIPVVPGKGDPLEEPGSGEAPRKSSGGLKTPVLVGTIAGGIIAVVFLVAILRGGSDHSVPDPQGAPAGAAGEAGAAPAQPRVIRGEEGKVALVSPIGFVPHGSLTFTWKPVPGIEEYEALLYNSEALRIWSSGRTQEDHVDLPAATLGTLRAGPAYFWCVVGYRPDGSQVRSPDAQFHLQP